MYYSLTTHAEKVQFLKNFLNGTIDGMTNARPLMLVGTGGNGKSYVILEVAKTSPVNLLVFYPGDGHRFIPAVSPSEECVILIHSNGSEEEAMFGYHLNAHVVEFKKDPAYATQNLL